MPDTPNDLPAKYNDGLVTSDEVKTALAEDDILRALIEEEALADSEYKELTSNVVDTSNLLAKLRRNKKVMHFRRQSARRRISARKRLVMHKLFERRLAAVRKELGLAPGGAASKKKMEGYE